MGRPNRGTGSAGPKKPNPPEFYIMFLIMLKNKIIKHFGNL